MTCKNISRIKIPCFVKPHVIIVDFTSFPCTALAADLPVPQPVPIFTWTGAYIGGQIGYAWASGANKFNGVDPYSGVAFVSSVGQSPSGVIGGANIGYNYQINQWVIGVEGSVDGTSLSNTGGLAFPDGTILAVHSSTDVQGSIRGRVGIAWDRALIFATGGVAFGGFNTQYNYDGCWTDGSHRPNLQHRSPID